MTHLVVAYYSRCEMRLIYQGVYFGAADEMAGHFARLGIPCDPQYNPADFISM